MATLRDLELEEFDTAPAWRRHAPQSWDRWVVLVDRGGIPVSALPPQATVEDGAVLPAVIVASADLSQGEAYSSAAFEEHADVAALVLIERGDGSDIAGVVGGAALRRAVAHGALRGGTALPGPPAIPWISRSCSYAEGGQGCATTMSFLSRPAVMPACGNQRGLAAHQFRW